MYHFSITSSTWTSQYVQNVTLLTRSGPFMRYSSGCLLTNESVRIEEGNSERSLFQLPDRSKLFPQIFIANNI